MNFALIDDHTLLTDVLMASLKKSLPKSNFKVFRNGKDFLSNDFDQWSPDIVISDVVMPEMDGIEMFKKSMPLTKPTCKFIFLSAVTEIYLIKSILHLGAKGFVSKTAPMDELLLAVNAIQQGKQYVSKALRDELLADMLSNQPVESAVLSPREKEVLVKLCEGRTAKEVAFDLNLSYNTIQIYVSAILRKLKFNRTLDVVVYALNSGLYDKIK